MKKIALTVGLAWGLVGLAEGADEPRRPNVVVVVADDLGYGDLGVQGGRDVPTPNLDALARGGVRCTNGYVSGPYCSPTRAGLLTGRYQQRFGHEFNPGRDETRGLPLDQVSLVERFRSAGYATSLVGKWHLGAGAEYLPQRRGFDEFFGFLGGAHTYFPGEPAKLYRGTEVVVEPEYLTDALAREATAFVGRNKDKPFFLEVAFNAVHTPMDATDARLAKFASIADPTRRKYAAMLSALDDAVGVLVESIRSAGLEEETLLFFFSDNGGPTMPGTSINGAHNGPLRGSKRTTLEGGIRVPFFVSWKGHLPAGATYDQPVIQLDILPTALKAAGIDPGTNLDGVDLLPALSGKTAEAPHAELTWRLGKQAAIRRGDWKLVRYDVALDTPGAVSRGEATATPWRLYNLAADVSESKDLAAEQPEKLAELTAAWQAWEAQLAKPLWGQGARANARNP